MIGTEDAALEYCRTRFDDPTINERLLLYASLLVTENASQNLVSTLSLTSIWRRHIVDSLQLLEHVPDQMRKWLDLGTGAGLPGLVIAIARPQTHFVLVEARRRRVEWLIAAHAKLGLQNCEIVGKKLEMLTTTRFDCISARAFAPLSRLLELSARFSSPNTLWLLPKGRSAGKEIAGESERIRSMFHVERSITDPQAGIIVGKGVPELS